MSGKKIVCEVTDLFKVSWKELTTDEMARVIITKQEVEMARRQGWDGAAGVYAIALLRSLRKDTALVDKLDVSQAVDCLNDILQMKSYPENPKYYISEPWFFFPATTTEFFEAPSEMMSNRCFAQLVYADSLFTKYLVSDYYARQGHPPQDLSPAVEAYLDDMIAVLYTPKESFDEQYIESNAKMLKLTEAQRMVIFHTYANIRRYIVKDRCPNFFNTVEEDEDSDQVNHVSNAPVYSGKIWQDILFDVAASPQFQGLNKTKSAYMFDVLDFLEKTVKESKTKKTNAQD